MEASARLAFAVADGARSRSEGVEQVTAMASEVVETDAPPAVAVHAGDRRWMSANGGRSWRAEDGIGGGIGVAVAVPPARGAAVVALTLTEDDHATLGVRRLYAAAWATQRGIVLGTSTSGSSWRQTMVAVPGGSGPCAMTATEDGVALACLDSTAIRCLRVSLDAVVSDGAHARVAEANWHHDSADLVATLKERQPALAL